MRPAMTSGRVHRVLDLPGKAELTLAGYVVYLSVDSHPAKYTATLSRRRDLQCRRLYLKEAVVIPPCQQLKTPARSTLLSLKIPERTAVFYIVTGPGVD